MSKWLKSTTTKAWVAASQGKQVIIPSTEPADKWLQLDETAFNEVSKTPVIASLIKAGGIIVLDEEPAELRNSLPVLQVENNQLQAELTVAKERIVALEAQLKNNTPVDVKALEENIRKQCAEEKQKALEELDAKASKIIEEKDITIKKLEKKIKKLGGNADEE